MLSPRLFRAGRLGRIDFEPDLREQLGHLAGATSAEPGACTAK
ncbi:hypothetical protein [Actinacidiphila sp. bgisy144]